MIPLPRNRGATQRLLRQSSAGAGKRDIPALYLTALGVTDLSLSKPPSIIDPQFAGEWTAFLGANRELNGDPARRALRATLSFLRYTDSMKIKAGNPRFTFRDPVTGNTKLVPNKVRLEILRYYADRSFTAIQRTVTSNRLPFYFRVRKGKVSIAKIGTRSVLVSTYVLDLSSNRLHLDAILSLLKGTLYDNARPPQLAPSVKKVGTKEKDQRPYYDSLLSGAGVIGWFPLERNAEFSLYVTRAKNGILVLKAIVNIEPVSKDNGDLPLTEHVKVWSKFKLI